ncbi:MAG: hydroxyacid dehydrogenase [Verrucomicrobiota bacterium]
MNKPKVLLIALKGAQPNVFPSTFMERLEKTSEPLSPPLEASEILSKPDLLHQTDYILGSWGMPTLDESLLHQMPNLKGVFYAAGSVKGFVTDAFWKKKIPLSAAAAANAVPVAEYTFAQIILSLKRFWHYSVGLRDAQKYQNPHQCFGCYRTTVGLISLGMIGRLVLEKLKTLDLHVIAYDPFYPKDLAEKQGIELVSLDELFERADVVSLHTPWLKETQGLIQKSHFLKMKVDATFINTSRGAVVHEEGMIEALQERPDLWALLDVTHPEPPVENSPIYTLPNIILTPHIAGSVGLECVRMSDWMHDELQRWLRGEKLVYEVTENQIARMA